ncbi:MAG: response regulator [Candidatus Nanopelagicales bacterium]|nr:response regulator [Candidatus Nanopelagicales bacterium]MDZ4248749.1 response regulator [Candidatus Nanopelagicales bacterium]
MATVLVVDDEPSVRSLLRDVLELDGYDVIEAADGEEALREIARSLPDFVILDIMMPGMSGLDVLRRLRVEHTVTDLPIMLLTAATDDETTWAGWTAGASVFIPKPFDPGRLLDWIEKLLASDQPKN